MDTKHLKEDFARKLKSEREAKGFTQSQLAEASGVRQSQISLYESGKALPSLVGLNGLAGALEVPVKEFLPSGIRKRDTVQLRGDVSRIGKVRRLKDNCAIAVVNWESGSPRQSEVLVSKLKRLWRKGDK